MFPIWAKQEDLITSFDSIFAYGKLLLEAKKKKKIREIWFV